MPENKPMRKVSTIVLATTNRHKLEEIQSLMKGQASVELVPADTILANADKLGLVEKFNSYAENVAAKARACNHGCHYPSLADDSGLEVPALGNTPGVRSHRFATPKAGQSQDEANNAKLLEQMRAITGEQRAARFVCHMALVMEGLLLQSVGVCEGTIITDYRGQGGFGYDPLFIPNGYSQTFAELGPDVKNKISHRAIAVQNLLEEIKKYGIVLAKP